MLDVTVAHEASCRSHTRGPVTTLRVALKHRANCGHISVVCIRVPCVCLFCRQMNTTHAVVIPQFPLLRVSSQRDMQELGNLPPTPAESAQLLWLAEAEHLLGTAFLHRAFACAPGTSLLTDTPTKHGYMTAAWNESVAAISLRAARGRRPWGFGSGPFTEVFPLTSEVAGSSESNGSGNTEEEVVDVMDEQAEAATIQMLEVSLEASLAAPSTIG